MKNYKKEIFEEIEVEIVVLQIEDIVTSSDGDPNSPPTTTPQKQEETTPFDWWLP